MTSEVSPKVVVAGLLVAACVAITIVLDLNDRGAAPAEPVIELIGNRTFTTAQIRKAIASSESSFLDANGDIAEDAVDREVLLISAFYWDRGHANAKIGTPRIDRARSVITIPVDEGPVFAIGAVRITGELLGTETSHLAMVDVKPGARFSRAVIAEDLEAISTFYQDKSYANANVLPRTELDLERRTVDLTFEIESGKPSTFERIEIVADTAASEAAIRAVLTVAAGQPFNVTRLIETKRRVTALGFGDVAISTKRGSLDTLVVATIEVVDSQ